MGMPENKKKKSKDLEKEINTNNLSVLNNKPNTYLPNSIHLQAPTQLLIQPYAISHWVLTLFRQATPKDSSSTLTLFSYSQSFENQKVDYFHHYSPKHSNLHTSLQKGDILLNPKSYRNLRKPKSGSISSLIS